MPKKWTTCSALRAGGAAEIGYRTNTAHLNGEAAKPVGEHADAIDHQVHHHGVVGIFCASKAGFEQGETELHEHHQVAGDERPDDVEGDFVLPDLIGEIADGQAFFGVGHGYVAGVSGERAVGITLGAGFGGGHGDVGEVGVGDGFGRRRGGS